MNMKFPWWVPAGGLLLGLVLGFYGARSLGWDASNGSVGYDPVEAPAVDYREPDASPPPRVEEASVVTANHGSIDHRARAVQALQQEDNGLRHNRLMEALRGWALEDPQAAASWSASLPTGADKLAAIRMVAVLWARKDAAAALAFASENSGEGPRGQIYQGIMAEWALHDFDAAFAWACDAGEQAEIFLPMVVAHAGREQLSKVAPRLASLEDKRLRMVMTDQLARIWVVQDVPAAQAWARGLEPELRDRAQGEILAHVGSDRPVEASKMVSALPPGDGRRMAVAVLSGQWAHQDPRAAAQWLMTFPDEQEQRSGIEPLIRSWTAMDRVEAARWIDKLSPGAVRDTAVSSFTGLIASSDPEGAAAYALTLTDRELRLSEVGQVLKAWKKRNPEAARAWIRNAPLDSEWKAVLLK